MLLEKTPPPSFEFLIMGLDFPVRMSLLMTAFSFAKIKSFQPLFQMGEHSDFSVVVPSSGTGAASWPVSSFS